MENLERTVKAIRSVKIQGAESIARASVVAFSDFIFSKKYRNREAVLGDMKLASGRLFSARPTEPLMRNAVAHIMRDTERSGIENPKELQSLVKRESFLTLHHFGQAVAQAAEYGANRIKPGMAIFTHCHSSTVMEILKKAKGEGKYFRVFNTEARPLFQGRISARELSRQGIDVTHCVDSAAMAAIKKADIILFGCDAITPSGIINKIGSDMFATIAEKYDVPVYICTDSWKFDPAGLHGISEKMESRPPKEVWPDAPRRVRVENPAFEIIRPEMVRGIISELGLLPHGTFLDEVIRRYRWLFV